MRVSASYRSKPARRHNKGDLEGKGGDLGGDRYGGCSDSLQVWALPRPPLTQEGTAGHGSHSDRGVSELRVRGPLWWSLSGITCRQAPVASGSPVEGRKGAELLGEGHSRLQSPTFSLFPVGTRWTRQDVLGSRGDRLASTGHDHQAAPTRFSKTRRGSI